MVRLAPPLRVRAQGLLVAFQCFLKSFQATAQAAFVQVGDGHRFVCGYCTVITLKGFAQLLHVFQRSTFPDQRLSVIWLERQHLIEAL